MYKHNFGRSLRHGKAGEQRFHALYPGLVRTEGLVEDFITLDGKTIELKSESRTVQETPNLAVEILSSKNSVGALQRAVQDKIDYIVWMYACGTCYFYNPAKLLEFVSKGKFRLVDIPNKSYSSTVALVPRDAVAHLEVEFEHE